MAESNRTERRLLDSIRKAKTGPDDDTADTASTGTGRSPPTTRQSTATRKTNGAAIPAKGPSAENTAQAEASMDRYQSSGRVWPD
jgi:hypothetical protein